MLPSAWNTNAKSSGSRRGRPPALDSSGVRLARASTHRRTPRSALGDRVDTLGSSSPHVLLSSSSSLPSSFSVLSLRLHAQQSQHRAPVGTPVRSVAPLNPATTTCFKCRELGHYANVCPKRNPPHTPVQNQQMQQMRNGNQTSQTNKGQQSYA
jgi:hypothetical protein